MNIFEIQKYCIDTLKQNKITDSNLKTRLIIAKTLKKPKEYLITHETEELKEKQIQEIKSNIDKIIQAIPIQYIIQNQEFMGLNFFVNENVLIPQPDTEILVEEVINILKNINGNKVLDLCTGSGAIAVSIKALSNPELEISASDISKKALEVAKINAKNNNVNIKFIESDLYCNITDKFNIIVSNPPYIRTSIISKLEKEVQNEPLIALDGGQDGLDFYRKIINNAHKYLENDGYLALEIGYDQKNQVIELIKTSKVYKNIYSKKDLSGNDRIIICQKR